MLECLLAIQEERMAKMDFNEKEMKAFQKKTRGQSRKDGYQGGSL
jgi:hypothetical protein